MSDNPPSWRAELERLCELAIEGQLTETTRDRLEEIATSDPDARRFYAEYLHQHACLSWAAAKPELVSVPFPRRAQAAETTSETIRRAQPRTRLSRWIRIGTFVLSSAAALLIGLWIGGTALTKAASPDVVATLTSTKAAKWSGGTLPTADGTQLTPGRLHLAEGVARLTFASGAEVSLEGPAVLDLVSRDRCVLVSGRLVANVPTQAIGFVVVTEAAELTDLGTEFGVSVGGSGSVDVAVFDGLVDVKERSSGQIQRITEGNTARVLDKQLVVYPSSTELPPLPSDGPTTAAVDASQRIVKITSAIGRGKDAYILSSGPPDLEHTTPGMLQVKNVDQPDSLYQRKTYVMFDLSSIAHEDILGARLDLTLIPTTFSSRFPDATFSVYGLTDDSADNWDEQSIQWGTAPGNGPDGAGVDPSKVMMLGQFVVERGTMQGTFGVEGSMLREFLSRDRNGLATIIVVRETGLAKEKSIIHGFASRRHATAAPPTLRITLRNPNTGS
jgi:ferric-dicitrate binding protein FerR (iron transport regulator)